MENKKTNENTEERVQISLPFNAYEMYELGIIDEKFIKYFIKKALNIKMSSEVVPNWTVSKTDNNETIITILHSKFYSQVNDKNNENGGD